MRYIFITILFSAGLLLLGSCGKSNPEPTCETGGTEVTVQP